MGRIVGDHFELLAEAARGGMGSVYRGRDQRTGRMVAIKVLDLTSSSDHVRFERECSLLSELHHPNIVAYVAHGISVEGLRFLVQEWVDGITLSTQIHTLGLTARDAIRALIGVSDALGAAHARGVVHRDVKPANIILDAGDVDRIKLVDFGIARNQIDSGVLTRTGILVGTPSYMAPEQARGSVEISPAADVWALGCVLYEALSGRRAFEGRSPEAIRAKVQLHMPTRIETLVPELSDELADHVHAMLAKSAGDRPRNGAEVATSLRKFLPTIADGQLRKSKRLVTQATVPTPQRSKPAVAERCYMLVTVPPTESNAQRAPVDLRRISSRHNLTMHALDDGAMLLEADAEASVAYAALEIQAEIEDGAISLFAKSDHEQLDEAIDRGADNLADVTMVSVFAHAMDAEPMIPLDDLVADMLERHGIQLVTTEHGRALRAPKQTS